MLRQRALQQQQQQQHLMLPAASLSLSLKQQQLLRPLLLPLLLRGTRLLLSRLLWVAWCGHAA
jgi:hypothetical protein